MCASKLRAVSMHSHVCLLLQSTRLIWHSRQLQQHAAVACSAQLASHLQAAVIYAAVPPAAVHLLPAQPACCTTALRAGMLASRSSRLASWSLSGATTHTSRSWSCPGEPGATAESSRGQWQGQAGVQQHDACRRCCCDTRCCRQQAAALAHAHVQRC
jgi:hypothetical protein